jgi:phospholipid transport system substrate-binding protein
MRWPQWVASIVWVFVGAWAMAAPAPDQFIQTLGNSLINTIRSDAQLQSGNLVKISLLVEEKILPHVRFDRMTASAVGPAWRSASPEQQQRLQQEFKTLLIRTYANAFRLVQDKTLVVKPIRMRAEDTQVMVRSELRGNKGEVITLDYRMVLDNDDWYILDINVMGLWLVESYRTQFASVVNQTGLPGLIDALARLNGSR